jgi:general secretion pathway protein G
MTIIKIFGTIVALLFTLFIILGIFAVIDTDEGVKESQLKARTENIASALRSYRKDIGAYPTTDEGLKGLVSNPGEINSWHGPYIEEDRLADPWGIDIRYESDGGAYRLISSGYDKQFDTQDDQIILSTDKPSPLGGE